MLSLGLLARDAGAYCRTTTVPLDASVDDPSVSGQCWTLGKDIAWPSGRVPYGVSAAGSKYFTAAQVAPVADQAFALWNSVTCNGRGVSVQAYDVGLVDFVPDGGACAVSTMCPAADDVIVFDDSAWLHNDPNNTLAITTVTYGLNDGRIFQAYTEVNTAQHAFTILEPPPSGSFSLQAVLSHEAGHFLGLAHSTVPSAVMWATYSPGNTQLTADDVAGLCAIYPPATPSSGGCQTAPTGASTAAGLGLGALGASALLRRRRRRYSIRG
jgi:MYXO-CTERM domain-containing protein